MTRIHPVLAEDPVGLVPVVLHPVISSRRPLARLTSKQPANRHFFGGGVCTGVCTGSHVSRARGEQPFWQDALERVAKIVTGPEPYLEDLKGRARSRARNPKARWFQAALIREPNNPHDRNAIAFHASGVGHVGYLDRETAIQYRPVSTSWLGRASPSARARRS